MSRREPPIIYIAGKFRGTTPWDVECNIREAEFWGLFVAQHGGIPLIPHTMFRHFDGSLPDEFWLSATMDLLRRCDALYLIPNWTESRGAIAERAEAERLNLPIREANKVDSFFSSWINSIPVRFSHVKEAYLSGRF